MEILKVKVLDRLRKYLIETQGEKMFSEVIAETCVDNAIEEIYNIRSYPDYYEYEVILADMGRYTTNIFNLALYDYAQSGMSFEQSHSENGTSRTYQSREKCLSGVYPLARKF